MNASDAVAAIRHVVQEHGDDYTSIGAPTRGGGIVWFGDLLRWQWPPSYLEVLEKHDGVQVGDTLLFSFSQSFERFLCLYPIWHRPAGFWPVASDGCGNLYALSFGLRDSAGECPVVFFDMTVSREVPDEVAANTYADLVVAQMARECRRAGCSRAPSH